MTTLEVEVVVPRHAADCIARSNPNRYGQCRCPKYLYVRRERLRISARTRSWDKARKKAQEYAHRPEPGMVLDDHRPRLREAIADYLRGLALSGVSEKTIANHKSEVNHLARYAAERNRTRDVGEQVIFISDVTPDVLTDFMASWTGRTKLDRDGHETNQCTIVTKRKKRKNLSQFFNYCVRKHWLTANPTRGMPVISKRQNASAIPKIPFTRSEMMTILGAAASYHNHERARMAHAMVGVMRHAGLSIGDTTRLERTRLKDDNRLEMYRTKTGNAVYLPLSPALAAELRGMNIYSGRYFFWNGVGKWESAANGWGKVFRVIFKKAKLKLQDRDGNPLQPSSHFFRNTFAKEMLESGVGMEQVAVLMGDKLETVREHYYKWVPDLQKKLDEAVMSSWAWSSEHTPGARRSQ